MPARKLSLHLILTAVMIAGVALVTATRAAAQTETVLHTFDQNGKDGSYPIAGLLRDASGNLYGTTSEGGAHGYGMVFEFSPNGSGGYSEKILHSFNFNNIDGFYPWSGVIFDASGNLY